LSPRLFRALATLGTLRRPFGIERRVFGAASIVRGCTRRWPTYALGQSATCVTSNCGKNNRLVRSTVVAGEQYERSPCRHSMRCSLLSETKPSPGRLTICRGLLIALTTSGRRRSSYGQSASNANCAPAGGAADLALGGSGYTDTINSCPAHTASDGDLRGYAIRLMKGRGRHSLR
jgi:hypothetical protein